MTAADAGGIVDFLTSNTFPFHVIADHTQESARAAVASGRFWNEESQGYWVEADAGRIGLVVVKDLQDDTPMFDLRLAGTHRGRGYGVPVVKATCDLVFTTLPHVRRFEGQTREDNRAMRRVFLRSGFLKEAHYRLGWPIGGNRYAASVAYAILRSDWESGTVTPFEWDD
ncbi:GNAT family protein [Arthrobacter sp. Br18]|uniref:GNAT family N-acetyltransferase n=1 Tax=Arthrobacter sp. Br18 TaxID=1312954 RepID=UPI0012DF18BA|nr:GNAT family protein [Arthrobacter sp. Br18]